MCRYDFLGKDTETKPEQANGNAAPGRSLEERLHREHKSSRDRDGTRDRHRDRDSHRDREDPDRRDKHRSSSRDHRSHKSSRHRDERDHRSSRDRDRPRDDMRDRHREDPRGQEAYKRPRMQEFVPRPAPPRYVSGIADTECKQSPIGVAVKRTLSAQALQLLHPCKVFGLLLYRQLHAQLQAVSNW